MLTPERPPGFPPIDLGTLDVLPELVWVTGPGGAGAYFNATWSRLTGAARFVAFEDFLDHVHPEDQDWIRAGWSAAREDGVAYETQYRVRDTGGGYRWYLARSEPVRVDGAVAGWIGTLVDVDDERRARDALVASEARARSIADALPQLIVVVGAGGELLWMNGTYAAYTGLSGEATGDADWADAVHPDDAALVAADWPEVLQRGEPHESQFRLRRYDGAYRWFLNKVIPVRDASGAITSWIGAATDIDERKRAEDALRVVVEASSAFAETLDATVALQRLADIASAHLADWCGVYVYDAAQRLKLVAIAHADANRVRLVREFVRRHPVRDDDPAAMVASLGEALRVDRIVAAMYDGIDDPAQRDFVRSFGLRAILYVPLVADGEHYGALALALAESDRAFTDEDEQLASLIAQRAAIAIGNARLFERQRQVARTLQAAFLPPALPRTADASFDGVYQPATRDLTIGGDWYDAFAYADGAFAFSVGDVAGRGLEAAVPMGKMRQTFRALAAVETDPARALAGADAVLRGEHSDVFVTAFVGTYDARTGALRYANAGHPSPFVRADDGTLMRLEAAGIPLGLGTFDALRTRDASLARGDLLVAFTDGLIEATHDIDEGERTVAEALVHPAFALCSDPAALVRALTVPQLVGDDVAILTLRAGGGADWSFDANDAHAAQAAREAFVARLVGERVSHDDRLGYEIIFGEIIGNVARYTPGRIDMALRRRNNRLVLAALDRGPGFDWTGTPPHDPWSENGRGLFLITTLAHNVRVEHLATYGTYLEVTLD